MRADSGLEIQLNESLGPVDCANSMGSRVRKPFSTSVEGGEAGRTNNARDSPKGQSREQPLCCLWSQHNSNPPTHPPTQLNVVPNAPLHKYTQIHAYSMVHMLHNASTLAQDIQSHGLFIKECYCALSGIAGSSCTDIEYTPVAENENAFTFISGVQFQSWLWRYGKRRG